VFQISRSKMSYKKWYSKSTNICSCDNPFQYCQLWHPPKSWIFFYLPWSLWREPISIWITCATNFKMKRCTHKKICEFYQYVSLGDWFFTSMWNFTHKMILRTIPRAKKIFLPTTHVNRFQMYIFLNESFGLEIWRTCY